MGDGDLGVSLVAAPPLAVAIAGAISIGLGPAGWIAAGLIGAGWALVTVATSDKVKNWANSLD